jgi:hypothetical protein
MIATGADRLPDLQLKQPWQIDLLCWWRSRTWLGIDALVEAKQTTST